MGWLLSNSCCVLGFLPNGLKLGWASYCAFRVAILTRNLPAYRIGLQQSGPSGEALGQFTDEHYGLMKRMTVSFFCALPPVAEALDGLGIGRRRGSDRRHLRPALQDLRTRENTNTYTHTYTYTYTHIHRHKHTFAPICVLVSFLHTEI